MRPVINFDRVTKIFKTYHPYHAGLKAMVLNPRLITHRRSKESFTAVNQVSFSVFEGETFGIVGRNGAGKSTLLALLAGVLRPTSGVISVQGRISPLLDLGVGLTPDLTGIENIIVNGVLLGLRRNEITAKIDDIIEFSGLHRFIDQPLLVDEVLAVGDAEFQEKCLERIAGLRRQGVTIVFVSHDLPRLETVCNRVAWIEKGQIAALGDSHEVISRYRSAIALGAVPADEALGFRCSARDSEAREQ